MIITFVKKINDTEVVAGDSITLNFNVGMRGAQGVQGIDGKSAYEMALEGGYVGTEQEFYTDLAMIKDADDYYTTTQADNKFATKTSLESVANQVGLNTSDIAGIESDISALQSDVTDLYTNKVDNVVGKELYSDAQADARAALRYTDAEKNKLAGLDDNHWKGKFTSLANLQAAFPTANDGDYASVDAGVGSDVQSYIWDSSDNKWVLQAGASTAETPATIKQKYESNADTNAFTDALKSKLNGIEAGAEVNVQSDWDVSDVNSDAYIKNKPTIPSTSDFVPYLGATEDVDLGNYKLLAKAIQLPNSSPTTPIQGDLYYDVNDLALVFVGFDGTIHQIGQEEFTLIVNKTNQTILDGQVCYINGAQGNRPTAALANSANISSSAVIGIATQDILNNAEGKLTTFGIVHGFNTTGMTIGGSLWLNGTSVSQTKPTSGYIVHLGYALNSTNNGSIFVNPSRQLALDLTSDSDEIAPTVKAVKAVTDTKRAKVEVGDAHGFVAPPNASNYSVSNTGSNFTFNLLSNAGSYKINGTDYTNNGLSVNFTAQIGQNFITLSSAGLSAGTTPFDIESLTYIPVAIISWDGTSYRVGDELHTSGRSLKMHKMEHDTDGARFVSGFATTFGSSANNTFSSAQGVIRDEDRYHTISAKTSGQILYRHSSLGYMVQDAPSTTFAKLAAGVPQYDNNGTLTNLANSQYGIMWQYATNAKLPTNSEIVFVVGQGTYSSVANAQAAVQPTLVGMAVAEWKLLYRVIVRNVGGALVYIQADDLRLTTTGLAVQGGSTAIVSASNVTSTNGNVQTDLDKLNYNPYNFHPRDGVFTGIFTLGLKSPHTFQTAGNVTVTGFYNQIHTSTSATGHGSFFNNSSINSWVLTDGLIVMEQQVSIDTLSNATEEFNYRFGVDGSINVTSVYPTSSFAEIVYNRALYGDVFVGACRKAGGTVVTVGSIAVSAGTNYVLRCELTSTSCKFYVNGVLLGEITDTNAIPNAALFLGATIVKTAGTTQRNAKIYSQWAYQKYTVQKSNYGDFKPIGF